MYLQSKKYEWENENLLKFFSFSVKPVRVQFSLKSTSGKGVDNRLGFGVCEVFETTQMTTKMAMKRIMMMMTIMMKMMMKRIMMMAIKRRISMMTRRRRMMMISSLIIVALVMEVVMEFVQGPLYNRHTWHRPNYSKPQ